MPDPTGTTTTPEPVDTDLLAHLSPPAYRVPWRTGRKVGRTIYAQFGTEPGDSDSLIGVMDTPELAAEAVRSHNAALPNAEAHLGEDQNATTGTRPVDSGAG
jgi:hypothetical protein